MDAVFGWLNNPIVLLAVGMIVRFVPGVRAVISNQLIPVLNIALAWFAAVIAPEVAHAAAGPVTAAVMAAADSAVVDRAGFGFGSMFGGLGGAILSAAQAWILNEMLLRRIPFMRKNPKDSKGRGEAVAIP